MKHISSAAEALRARHQTQPWFRSVSVEADGIVLLVKGCPFSEHRAIGGHPVVVRECVEWRP